MRRTADSATPVPAGSQRQAVRKALELLARRPRTEAQLRTALARQVEPEHLGPAVARLRSLGYLDDAVWARDYVASGRARGRSAALLRRELLANGVPGEDVASAVEAHDDAAAALEAAHRRLRALTGLDPARRARRLRDHLARRGFGPSVVEATLRRVLDGNESAG